MRLEPHKLVHGVAPAILRNCARTIRAAYGYWTAGDRGLTIDDFAESLGAGVGESRPVLDALTNDGFFIFAKERARWIPTLKIGRLAQAPISRGIPRKEATALLSKVVDAARRWNEQHSREDGVVVCLAVFGSYLSDKLVLGDLDIGVETVHRGLGTHDPVWEWRQRLDSAIYGALRLRKPTQVSLHGMDEVLRLQTPYEIVFGHLPEAHARRVSGESGGR